MLRVESEPKEIKINIAIASDHAGYEYKEAIKSHLNSNGIGVRDFGTDSARPVDYPKFVQSAAQSVADGECDCGIILGGSGNEAIVANRIVGIRCAVIWNERTAQLSKEHGDCNMISIGSRMMAQEEAILLVDIWINAKFLGGRHQRRIDQIDS
jgi:ribose 5-phosphate isomerase B